MWDQQLNFLVIKKPLFSYPGRAHNVRGIRSGFGLYHSSKLLNFMEHTAFFFFLSLNLKVIIVLTSEAN